MENLVSTRNTAFTFASDVCDSSLFLYGTYNGHTIHNFSIVGKKGLMTLQHKKDVRIHKMKKHTHTHTTNEGNVAGIPDQL